HAHYDLGNAFYAAWLDPSMTYSSARFERPDQSLQEAQQAKYAALARLMDLKPGHRVLEIGCGWGGFAEFAAREVGALVTGVTISREQHDYARRRMFEAGLAERADIRLLDYRDVQGRFDRVASIEMFEAVGREYWPTYFQKIHDVLEPGGRAGLQVITIQNSLFEEYDARTDFIQKYVFPGGSLPSEDRMAPVIEKAGLKQTAVDRFGLDYADTLAEWTRRFDAAWTDIRSKSEAFDSRVPRLWRYYLPYCEAGFRSGRTDVIQTALDRAVGYLLIAEPAMNPKRTGLVVLFAVGTAATLSACATLQRGPVGNSAVPQPAKAVDLNRYAGLWYEIGRYENGFERGCEAVTAEYGLRDDGLVSVLNTCRQGAVDGPVKTAQGRAKVTPGSDNAKLKVSFFGPFYVGDYWVLDRAEDYSWSIVGEPS